MSKTDLKIAAVASFIAISMMLVIALFNVNPAEAKGVHPVWVTDKEASALIAFDIEGPAECVGYGKRKKGTQLHRRFDCIGLGESICTFTIRLTSQGIRYRGVFCE